MRISPAKAHFMRATAAQAVVAPEENAPQTDNQYELLLLKLAEDRRRLKEIQSVERKIEAKAKMLPEYAPYIEGVLTAATGRQDDVLVTVMIWRIDTGDYAGALPIARYALAHSMTPPDNYNRTLACLVAEEFAEQSLSQSAPVDPVILADVLTLVGDHDMPDEVRAKLHKALGLSMAHDTASPDRIADAIAHLKRAVQLHDKVGAKKDIEQLERALKNLTAPGG